MFRFGRGLNSKKSNSSSDSLKHRRITALPKDLLYPLENKDLTEDENVLVNRNLSGTVSAPASLK